MLQLVDPRDAIVDLSHTHVNGTSFFFFFLFSFSLITSISIKYLLFKFPYFSFRRQQTTLVPTANGTHPIGGIHRHNLDDDRVHQLIDGCIQFHRSHSWNSIWNRKTGISWWSTNSRAIASLNILMFALWSTQTRPLHTHKHTLTFLILIQ